MSRKSKPLKCNHWAIHNEAEIYKKLSKILIKIRPMFLYWEKDYGRREGSIFGPQYSIADIVYYAAYTDFIRGGH